MINFNQKMPIIRETSALFSLIVIRFAPKVALSDIKMYYFNNLKAYT